MGEYANKAMGKTKKTVGKYTGNRSLQAKGAVQEFAGKAQGAAKEVGRSVRRATSNVRSKAARPATKRGKVRRASITYSRT